MITVYKYCIEDYKKNVCRVILPIGAQILKIYSNGNKRIDMWAKVDTATTEEVCYFYVIRTGENITKRLEQRDKNKTLEYIDSFYDKDDVHWHIFKAAAAAYVTKTYWNGNTGINVQPLISATPSWSTLCGNTTNSITVSSCCDNDNDGTITLTNSGSALTINKNDIDINTIED